MSKNNAEKKKEKAAEKRRKRERSYRKRTPDRTHEIVWCAECGCHVEAPCLMCHPKEHEERWEHGGDETLLPYLPNPIRIRIEMAKIRAGWSEAERQTRSSTFWVGRDPLPERR